MTNFFDQHQGVGMTSSRTRDRMIQRLYQQGIKNIKVLEVMQTLPRHIFLDQALAHRAYEDVSLPIGRGQTLSQPYTHARMSELIFAGQRVEYVLEIGTGSGYQTALLARLFKQVFSVERLEHLQKQAKQRHQQLGFDNIRYKVADGEYGWPELGPFDAIICTCAPTSIPKTLIRQLSDEGGRLIIPIGDKKQSLWVVERQGEDFKQTCIEDVFFVPLKSGVIYEKK